jgi:hypothetical protein
MVVLRFFRFQPAGIEGELNRMVATFPNNCTKFAPAAVCQKTKEPQVLRQFLPGGRYHASILAEPDVLLVISRRLFVLDASPE